MRRAGFAVLILTGVYAMVLASFHPWDLFFGLVVSGALVYAFRSFVFGGQPDPLTGLAGRVAAFFPFVVAVVWDVLKGTWEVALITLHIKPLVEPGVVKLPVRERTPTGVAVLGLVTTLSPGAFLIEANDEFMLIHVIDASDPDAFREDREYFYRRYQRKVFP
jgi:multisubunit Na+/H+ antiporter MnhE subunit